MCKHHQTPSTTQDSELMRINMQDEKKKNSKTVSQTCYIMQFQSTFFLFLWYRAWNLLNQCFSNMVLWTQSNAGLLSYLEYVTQNYIFFSQCSYWMKRDSVYWRAGQRVSGTPSQWTTQSQVFSLVNMQASHALVNVHETFASGFALNMQKESQHLDVDYAAKIVGTGNGHCHMASVAVCQSNISFSSVLVEMTAAFVCSPVLCEECDQNVFLSDIQDNLRWWNATKYIVQVKCPFNCIHLVFNIKSVSELMKHGGCE